MDLRGCSQMYFISTIRGGEVIKVPNLIRGKSALKFSSVEEIYSSIDSKCHDSLTKYPPKVERSLAMPFGSEIKTEVKAEFTEEDELEFSAMTLRQLKDICKSHKRKASSSVDLTTVKEEGHDLQREEDELDLKKTLSSWRRKVLKRTNARKKGISSSKFCKPLNIKVEDAEHEHSQPQAKNLILEDDPGNSTCHTVKADEHCCPDQDLNMISGNPKSYYLDRDRHSHEHLVHPVSIEKLSCCLNQVSYEHLDHPVSTEKSSCCLNQVSYEHLDHNELQNPLISKKPKMEETIKVESSVDVGDQSLFICGSNVRRKEDKTDLMSYDAPTATVRFGCDNSDLEEHHLHRPDGNVLSKIHVPCIGPSRGFKDAEITNLGEAIGSTDGNQDSEGEVMRKPAKNCNSMLNSGVNFPSSHGLPFLDKITTAVEDEQFSVLAVTTEELSASPLVPEKDCHDSEFINRGEASRALVDDPITEEKASRRDWENCEVVVQDENCMSSFSSVESLHNVPFVEYDNQSSALDSDIVLPTCSPEIQHCAASDQDIESGTSEGHNENKLVQQPPERLFSARKSISPNSKEKLRRAMNLAEMQDDNDVLSCKEKLSFEKNCVDASSSRPNPKKARIILTSKRMEALHTTDIKANTRKGKYAKNLSFVKVTGKGFQGGPSIHAGSQCNSSLSCSQNAIAFSQQQMIDTERLALKLLTKLHSMKEIVVDTLHSESRTCTTSKNSTDKARVVVDNVKKVEETTKRWLSIMSRDCNRFCKILEAAETTRSSPEKRNNKGSLEKEEICQNNPSSAILQDGELSPPENTVNREKKIMFADEAGDSLCHVKVLEAKND